MATTVAAQLRDLTRDAGLPAPHDCPCQEGTIEYRERLGKGAYGEVWRVIVSGEVFALKKMKLQAHSEQAAERELDALRKLRHPRVISFHGAFVLEPSYWDRSLNFLLEYAEHGDLEMWVKDTYHDGPVPAQDALRMLRDVCDGVAFLHSNDVVHRDLNARNVLVTEVRRFRGMSKGWMPFLKITDFGISKELRGSVGWNSMKSAFAQAPGTAPELAQGVVTKKTDVWALGKMLDWATNLSKTPESSTAGVAELWARRVIAAATNPNEGARCGLEQVRTFLSQRKQVFFKTITGKTFTLDLDQFDTIEYVKERIEQDTRIRPDLQRLILNGQQLEDDRSLPDYDIQILSTINIVLCSRGGMYHETSGRSDLDLLDLPTEEDPIPVEPLDLTDMEVLRDLLNRENRLRLAPETQQKFANPPPGRDWIDVMDGLQTELICERLREHGERGVTENRIFFGVRCLRTATRRHPELASIPLYVKFNRARQSEVAEGEPMRNVPLHRVGPAGHCSSSLAAEAGQGGLAVVFSGSAS
mmetsp:Transcript_78421/g.205806  ORF Transcript_78421/g.205806 Transcript_78421/m.205806 type:complete len:530 (-) Transcript_78421:542-2131(-)